jgi:hypothetical protein
VSVDRVAPVAHLPLGLGVLWKLEIATLIDSMIPAHDEQVGDSPFAWAFMMATTVTSLTSLRRLNRV